MDNQINEDNISLIQQLTKLAESGEPIQLTNPVERHLDVFYALTEEELLLLLDQGEYEKDGVIFRAEGTEIRINATFAPDAKVVLTVNKEN